MARILYSCVLYLLAPLVFLHLWLRGTKAPAYRQGWLERLAFYSKATFKQESIVIHCASVGEVVAATPLIKQLISQRPTDTIIITCNTPTGKQQIEKAFGEQVQCCYLPLDFPGAVERFIAYLQPKLLCILETELWPNLIIKSQQAGIPVLLLNARLSEKSLKGYQKIKPLASQIMQHITCLAAHNVQDAERFLKLNLKKQQVAVTGSIKFDIKVSNRLNPAAIKLQQQVQQHSFIWVAGSTHPIEHQKILSAHQAVLAQKPDALLIIAPRHPEQFDAVADLIQTSGLSFSQRSNAAHQGQQCLLADSLGEMLTFFAITDVAYIGGSLIERGGHNPLEAAAFSKPILSGPSYYNFMHVYPELIASQGCEIVNSQQQLANSLLSLCDAPNKAHLLGENAKKVVDKNSGAIAKTLAIINQHIE